jgi:hypothetical protein
MYHIAQAGPREVILVRTRVRKASGVGTHPRLRKWAPGGAQFPAARPKALVINSCPNSNLSVTSTPYPVKP